jgi:hypothetical protein
LAIWEFELLDFQGTQLDVLPARVGYRERFRRELVDLGECPLLAFEGGAMSPA